jgi:Ca2+-binding EF-hand superfamily protein
MKRGGRMGHMAHGRGGARRGGPQRGGPGGMHGRPGMAGGAGSRARMGHHLMMLAQLDANHDQQISKEELTALFDKIDANSDGNITAEEGKKFHETQRAEMMTKMKEAFSPEGIIKKLDKNGDGKLSKDDEIKFWDRLSHADADKDGSVTKEELEAGMKKMREAMQQHRGRRGRPKKDEPKKEEPAAETKSDSAAIEAEADLGVVEKEATETAAEVQADDADAVEAVIPTDTSALTPVE